MKIEHCEDGSLVLTLDWKDGDLRAAIRVLDLELGFQPAARGVPRQIQFLSYNQSIAWNELVKATR